MLKTSAESDKTTDIKCWNFWDYKFIASSDVPNALRGIGGGDVEGSSYEYWFFKIWISRLIWCEFRMKIKSSPKIFPIENLK